MKIITWNINGFKSILTKGELKNLLNQNYDIICFQETKISDINIIKNNIPNNYYVYSNISSTKGHHGVSIITKEKPLKEYYKIGHDKFDSQGRYIKLDFENFTLINMYIPHGGRQKQELNYKLEALDKIIKNLNTEKTIITTDLNIAKCDQDVCRAKSNYNNIMFTPEERNIINKIIKNNYIDIYRELNKDEIKYTWWPYAFDCRNRNVGWRIDYIFITKDLLSKVKKASINNNQYGSDHCPVVLEIDNG